MRIKLKDVFELQIGKTPSRNKSEYWNGVYKWVSISDIGNSRKYVYSTRESITDKGIIDSGIKVIPKGTVIMSFKLSIGKTAITTEDMYTNEAIVAFIDKKKIPIDIDYLYYLCSGSNWMQVVNKAVMGLTLNKATLSEKEINIPNIKIQKKCAGNLDKIDRIIDLKKQQLDQLDLIVRSLFIEMFGDVKSNSKKWIKKQFTDIALIDTNMLKNFDNYENYPHIGIDSIEKETGEIIGYRTVQEDKVVSGKYLFTQQHIIYSKIRPNLNKVALPNFNGVCSADAYPILVKNKKCHRVFLAYIMRSKLFLDYIIKLSNRTNLPKVNKKQVEGFICPVPPLDLQNRFAEYVSSIDKSKLAVKKSVEELEILKKSLMQKYFA